MVPGTIYVGLTKTLISCKANIQLNCAFDFVHAKSSFSHDTAQMANSCIHCPKHLDYQGRSKSRKQDKLKMELIEQQYVYWLSPNAKTNWKLDGNTI